MRIRVRTYRRGGYEVDIRFTWPDGAPFRARFRSPVTGRSASQRWGEAREMVLLRAGQPAIASPQNTKEVPTLAEFWPRFIDGHCRANRHKPSGIEGKESVYRVYLAPRFGGRRLDSLRNEDIQTLKADMATKSAKTVNNVLTALSRCLKVAVEWDVMERVPCTVRLLKVTSSVPGWYEILEYERLVEAAQKIDPRIHIMVLLAGSAGMRRCEIMALKWSDLDLKRRLIQVQRSIWEAHETVPKGGKRRVVDMTSPLADARQASSLARRPRALRGRRAGAHEQGRALMALPCAARSGHRRDGSDPSPPSHVLLDARGRRRASPCHSGARWPQPHHDDDEVHAPVPDDARRGHRAARSGVGQGARRRPPWRHCGDGGPVRSGAESIRVVEWWRRRESNPGPKTSRLPASTCVSGHLHRPRLRGSARSP